MDACGSVFAALDELVLERDKGEFTLLERPPAWFHRLGLEPPEPGAPIAIERFLPFLDAFLPEAEQVWRGGNSGRGDSGMWTEVTPAGDELHLEASALLVGGSHLLVITRNDALFQEQRRVLQRARELSLAHAALSREIERRDVLIHCIVHDLAGPLNGILGVLSLIEERGCEPRGELVRLAMKAALHQRELIREILDAFVAERSALEAAPDELGPLPDLCAVVAEVVEERLPSAASRGVRLEATLGPPCPVFAEERRLTRVLFNLLDNALRHTPTGKAVRVTVTEEPEARRVAVEDEGSGVPAAVVPHLFQKFARGRDPTEGSGLGLYFCRITVESWGGTVGYEPLPGGGSRFWVRLVPAAGAADSRAGEMPTGETSDGEALGRRR
jgi:signal transduction histidine kinase